MSFSETTYQQQLFHLQTEQAFNHLAMQAFVYQYTYVPLYRSFCDALNKTPLTVNAVNDIPFLPIEFFKTHQVISSRVTPQVVFESSGTTGAHTSKHYVAHTELYTASHLHTFKQMFGDPQDFCFLALLPGYMERQGSSLIYMVNDWMKKSQRLHNGFYLHAGHELVDILQKNEAEKIPTVLIGVTFSLLEFAEKFPLPLSTVKIIETGGMKGKRKEMIRAELHTQLKQAFQVPQIYSEYGMTELLSQAYCMHDEDFICPPWMKIIIRETNDPLTQAPLGYTGGVNVIDLANIYSCCFIATQDLGKKTNPDTFQISGRFDNSDVRGCNLLTV